MLAKQKRENDMSVLVLTENGKLVKRNISLYQASTALDLADKTIVVNTPQLDIGDVIAWPSNMALEFKEGGYVTFTGAGSLTGLKEARPEYFGVNTIPGTTDMTAAIQKAFNAAKVVKFTSMCGVSDAILMPEGLSIISDSVYNGVRLIDGTNPAYVDFKYGILYSEGSSNITIDGITIDGNEANNDIAEWNLHNVSFFGGSNNKVINCRSLNSNHEGLLWYESSDGLAENNYTFNSRNSGIASSEAATSEGTCARLKVLNNNVQNSGIRKDGITGGATGITINGPFSLVDGNTVNNTGLHGINIGHQVLGAGALTLSQSAHGTVLTNNTITNTGYLSNEDSSGVSITHGNDSIIQGNTVDGIGVGALTTGQYQHGIASLGSSATVGDLYLHANNIVVANNQIKNVKGSGIAVADTKGWTVSNNKLQDCLQGTNASQSFIRFGGSKDIKIRDNDFILDNASGGSTKFLDLDYLTTRTVFNRVHNVNIDGNRFADSTDTIRTWLSSRGLGVSSKFKNNMLTLGATRSKFISHTDYTATDPTGNYSPVLENNSYNGLVSYTPPLVNVSAAGANTLMTFTIPFKLISTNVNDFIKINLRGVVTGTTGTKTLAVSTAGGVVGSVALRVIPAATAGLVTADILLGYAGISTVLTFSIIGTVTDAAAVTPVRGTVSWSTASTTDLAVTVSVTLSAGDSFLLLSSEIVTP